MKRNSNRMKKFNITLVLVLCINLIYAQSPLVKQWDYRYGGDTIEWIGGFQKTLDEGFIIGGTTYSDSSGDISQHSKGNGDFWIVKTDDNGIKLWDKRFGGLNEDYLGSLQQTTDKGYILGGYTKSDSSGDVSEHTRGLNDYWMVKTDSLGNKQWDKRFGGTNLDYGNSILQTSDGGYIMAGAIMSDSSGDITEATKGINDYWIVKTDFLGNKLWDKRYGGSGDDRATKIIETSDKGFLIGGFTNSDSSGDVSQHTRGNYDFWIVKTDSLGVKQWDKRFGGSNADMIEFLYQTDDKGYFLLGETQSDSTGDVSHHILCPCGDEWVVRIDSVGNKIWDNCYGGTVGEDEGFILKTTDGNYLLGINSYSPASGEKSENNLGQEQSWLLKIDPSGNKIWDKTILTTGHDEYTYIAAGDDGCYVIANMTNSGIGGDKTQPNWGTCLNCYDLWIIKYCDSTLTGISPLTKTETQLLIYPNPFNSEISIIIQKQNLKEVSFEIQNVLGQTVFRKEENNLTNTYTNTIDLSKLAKGIYLLGVNIDGERTVKKIVKQ